MLPPEPEQFNGCVVSFTLKTNVSGVITNWAISLIVSKFSPVIRASAVCEPVRVRLLLVYATLVPPGKIPVRKSAFSVPSYTNVSFSKVTPVISAFRMFRICTTSSAAS